MLSKLRKRDAAWLANHIYSDRRFSVDDEDDWICTQAGKAIASPHPYGQRLDLIVDQTRDYFLPFYTPKSSDVIIDVGAGIGEEMLVLADRVRTYIAIEAHPVTFRCLQKTRSLSGLDNAECLHVAVADKEGDVTISTEENHLANSIGTAEGATVEARTLAQICAERDIKKIDFLKANIEGAERLMIGGMGELIVEHVAISCHDFVAETTGDDFFRTKTLIVSWLESKGYDIKHRSSAKPWINDTVYASLRTNRANE
jgi:FkbM family methyltransferase